MAKYSIKDLETLTGVKAHTIRIWEQRYNLLVPDRTETNIRTYNDEQLRKLLRANVLYSNGYKISKIALLNDKQLVEEIEVLSRKDKSTSIVIESLTIAMIEMNEQSFEDILSQEIEDRSFEKVMNDIVYPFLDRIGVLWLTGVIEPAQEHFISNLIRQKIIVAINDVSSSLHDDSPVCIAFLHQEEMHELGLLYYTYHIKMSGYKVVYLGQMTPYADVIETSRINKPDLILTSFVKVVDQEWLDSYVQRICNDFSYCDVAISGIEASKASLECDNLYKISSADHMKETILHLNK